jgi:biotin carboxyl carrier protein
MSDHDDRLERVRYAADQLLPKLIERLARHRLGELEVSEGDLRVRVAGTPAAPPIGVAPMPGATERPASKEPAAPAAPATQGVTSPAVGFFIYTEGLGPGLTVQKGDELGHVEMLGVRHDVRAPRGGTVRSLVTEAGEPVEYGQLLVELEPGG